MLYSKSNQSILAELDKVVYGHKEAKIALINLVNRSKLRYHQIYHSTGPVHVADLISNINCLLIGDSGTGKTHLMQSLSDICEFPLVCIDANQLCPTSASDGINVEKLIKLVKRNASSVLSNSTPGTYFSKEGIERQTIVFIDEIDKLAKTFDSSGNWNRHVQANFLSVFENHADLDSLSFVFAGAFSGMNKRAEQTKSSMGFANDQANSVDKDFDIEQEVIKYGLIPELVGRIHNIVVLDKLEEKDFRTILNSCILPDIVRELKLLHINEFKLTEEDEDRIISKALKSSMGVRAIRKEILKLAQNVEFDYEWTSKVTRLELKKEDPVSILGLTEQDLE